MSGMDKLKITPKDFFLWVGAMVALYASAVAYVALMFDYLNYLLPDKLSYYSGDPYSSGISNEMATLVVLFPMFLFLMRMIGGSIAADASRADIWVRRWALFLTLFVAAAAMAGGIITLLVYFFQGDVTLRFALKVATVLIVAAVAFASFRADLRGYWSTHPNHVRNARWLSFVLMLASIIAGFLIVGTPWQARLYRYDDQKVGDLQSLQYQVVNYWQSKEKLPATLADLRDPIGGFAVPVDPQTGAAYEYEAADAFSFKLCASFNAETQPYSAYNSRTAPKIAPAETPASKSGAQQDSWRHGAGRVCFTRTIDPQLYPQLYPPFPRTKVL